jgi:polysaccharide export outer membrane protein
MVVSSIPGYAQNSLSVPSEDPAECESGKCPGSSGDDHSADDPQNDQAPARRPGDEEMQNVRTEDRNRTPQNRGLRSGEAEQDEYSPGYEREGPDGRLRKERDENSSQPALRSRKAGSSMVRQREPLTEFQKQVFESTGRHLPVYGQELFRNVPSTFAPLDHVPVPPDYVIGPGDELLIHSWGQINADARPVVDRNGQISLARVGTISVAGIHYSQLEKFLKTKVGQYFRNFDLSVNLGKLRSIQVLIVGRVRHPGSYTVGSFSTLVNALFASGGPSGAGSMRDIQLKRNGKLIAQLDLYDLLLQGASDSDLPLLPGDVIYVPPASAVVAVNGSVNLPAIYELRGPATAKQAIDMAGGLSPVADSGHVLLETSREQKRELQKIELDNPASPPLANGDIVTVYAAKPSMDHVVSLRGSVSLPGRYAWQPGMRVGDLVPSREWLITRFYLNSSKRFGGNGGDWYHEERPVEKKRAPRQEPERTPETEPDRYQTQVIKLSGEINWEHATIQRRQKDLSTVILPFNLGHALDDPQSADNMKLEDHDVVSVFALSDQQSPSEKRSHTVHIEGEVNAPGAYTAGPGETLRDMVAKAGGLTSSAYLFASEFRRESTRREQQKQIEQMADSMEKDLRLTTAALPKSSADERAAAQEQLASENRVLDKLRRSKATGRIVLEIKPGDFDLAAIPALRLEDGDRLIVPPRPATVEVVGAVYNQNSFIYKTGKTVRECLQQSGGGTRDADGKRLFVVRADGTVVSKQMHRGLWNGSFEAMTLTPGDTILMPERIRTGSLLKGIRDWSQVFSQFALGAAALRVVSP